MTKEIVETDVEGEEVETEGEDMDANRSWILPSSPTSNVSYNLSNTEFHYLDLTDFFDNDKKKLPEVAEPLMAIWLGNKLEHPQVQTHALEPNTQTLSLSSLLPLKRKLHTSNEGERDNASEAPHKVVYLSDQAALPPTKSKLSQHELSISPSIPSQKEIEMHMTK